MGGIHLRDNGQNPALLLPEQKEICRSKTVHFSLSSCAALVDYVLEDEEAVKVDK
jgi:hypothetical protein